MDIGVGTRVGPYEVVSVLGSGGMGRVYLARDSRLDRTVALKVLAADRATDPEARKRLQSEALAIARLKHPHICALYDVGSSDGFEYLVMEHLEGDTLDARLARGPLPLEQALEHAIAIGEALEVAHRSGIVHRDLKPTNVMITSSGAKLLDFGIAVPRPVGGATDVTQQAPLTVPGIVMGTPEYMAPEQIEGRRADARSDLFAFGLLLYEMITGTRAFRRGPEALLSILRDTPPPVSTIRPEAAALDRVVARLLEKDPDRRWQTATDLVAELRWIRESARTPDRGASLDAGRGTRGWSTWSFAAGWALAAVLAVALGYLVWRGGTRAGAEDTVRFTIPVDQPSAMNFGGALGARLALSPNGTKLVYVAEDAQGGRLYVRELHSLDATPLPGTQGATSVFFSPDGEWVGFFGGGKLKKVRLAGGALVTLCDAANGVGASWGSDGFIVFAPAPSSPLFRVPAEGGTPERVTTLMNGETSHRWPEIVPGGHAVVFAAASGPDFTGSQIVAQSLRTGQRVTIANGTYPRYSATGHLVFARNNTLFAVPFDAQGLTVRGSPISVVGDIGMNSTTGAALYTFSAAGTLVYRARATDLAQRDMVWVTRDGAEEVITTEPRPFLQPRLSPEGRRVAVSIGESAEDRDVWLFDLERRLLTRLTFEPGEDETPVWNPEGTRLAISAARENRPRTIFTIRPDDAPDAPQVIATTSNITHLGDWSPDGRALAWTEFDPVTGNIRLLSFGPPQAVRTVIAGPFGKRSPAFSPDGRWLAYISNEAGRADVFVRSLMAGDTRKWPISTEGGAQPVWSRDGRELYYRSRTHVMAVAVSTTGDFSAGPPHPLFADKYEREHRDDRDYDVARDGRFLMLRPRSASGPPQLHVILNWFHELRGRVS